ncbi:uncharacterized protein LOC132732392 isoform X2 [Ruditapes philippinarum]|uniref:uncharacterized protein LOC132732392 isoform X2 n=1 Tax=Ruditapes philippinarum TaxID=129788 RepID=UPI00295A78DF|nr:uncharacterized protein LOC132732392 isoform X2 [Ruditapes philippinarum]XP_060574786.1 uncharacterized protein LOC132732392 isoform X2 [Ruditapes philippinarum]
MAESAFEDDLKFSLLVEGVVRKAQTETTNERKRIEKDRECLLQGMTAMCELSPEIETVEDFDTFMKRVVDSERQKRYIAKMEEDKLNREHTEGFYKEVNESISNIVAMGYDPDEVKKVMEKAYLMYDSESALKILQKRARKREEKKAKVTDDFSISGGISMHVSETNSITENCSGDGVPERLSVSVNTSLDGSSHSEEFPLAVYDPQKTTVTHEILYQRKKDV